MPTFGDYNYDLINVDQARITGYIGSTTDVVIPDTLDGYPVTAIGANAFEGKGLTSVTIPNTVTSIGNFAFRSNSLTSIVIPDSVITIGSSAFRSNSLTSINIPTSVTSVGSSAFQQNSINYLAINHSYGIAHSAFMDNPFSLGVAINVNIVNTVGSYPFQNCNLQNRLTFGPNVTLIPANIGYNAGLTSIIIPNTINSIGISAFRGNSLISVIIPSSVVSVGTNAFQNNNISLFTVLNATTTFSTFTSGVLHENPGGIIRGWPDSTAKTLADSYAHYVFEELTLPVPIDNSPQSKLSICVGIGI